MDEVRLDQACLGPTLDLGLGKSVDSKAGNHPLTLSCGEQVVQS